MCWSRARIPNLESLDLAKAGIQRLRADPTRIQVSRGLKTSNARVYAVGDAAGGSQSMQGALHQAQVVARGALLAWPTHNDPLLVPRIVYTDPEIAEVGLSEATARTRHGIRFRVTRWNFADNDLARARRQTFGLAKLITDRSGKIIGAGVAGPGAGELIALFSLAMASGLSARDLGKFVAADPSLFTDCHAARRRVSPRRRQEPLGSALGSAQPLARLARQLAPAKPRQAAGNGAPSRLILG